MQDWYSVEQVADRLGLHVRTVRGYVRDGRLNAVRIGKQYRVARADLEALTGRPAGGPDRARRVDVSSIVDVDGIDADTADRVAAFLTGLPKGPRTDGRALLLEAVHDPERARLKIVIAGSAGASVELLRLVAAMVEEEPWRPPACVSPRSTTRGERA